MEQFEHWVTGHFNHITLTNTEVKFVLIPGCCLLPESMINVIFCDCLFPLQAIQTVFSEYL